jgi:endogenous inhibitor of DNA gyrase (YacG/DUF329 family)
MKHYWSNKVCLICATSFVDKSHAQKAKYCSKKCRSVPCKDWTNQYSRKYKARHDTKEKERNKVWYEAHKVELKVKSALWTKNNRPIKNAIQAKRRAAKLNATPKWLIEEQLQQIKRYYVVAKWVESILNEPIDVDHICPLQGENVSGLHVPWNLQLLTSAANTIKANK